MLLACTAAAMIFSEVFAWKKKKKVGHDSSTGSTSSNIKNLIIFNFIPFTNLNVIFALSFTFGVPISIFVTEPLGIPKISVQGVIILISLLSTNTEAKTYFKKKLFSLLGLEEIVQTDEIELRNVGGGRNLSKRAQEQGEA